MWLHRRKCHLKKNKNKLPLVFPFLKHILTKVVISCNRNVFTNVTLALQKIKRQLYTGDLCIMT